MDQEEKKLGYDPGCQCLVTAEGIRASYWILQWPGIVVRSVIVPWGNVAGHLHVKIVIDE